MKSLTKTEVKDTTKLKVKLTTSLFKTKSGILRPQQQLYIYKNNDSLGLLEVFYNDCSNTRCLEEVITNLNTTCDGVHELTICDESYDIESGYWTGGYWRLIDWVGGD